MWNFHNVPEKSQDLSSTLDEHMLNALWIELVERWVIEWRQWYKISYKWKLLNVPIFENEWTDTTVRIVGFLRKMAIFSCREELFWVLDTCKVQISYQGSKNRGKWLSDGTQRIVWPEDFINFVGIPIDLANPFYVSVRRTLALKGIYPEKNTMIEDFMEFWNKLPATEMKRNKQPMTAEK